MAQLIQLEQRIVQVFKFKVGRQQTALDVVRRVLDGAEVVNVEGSNLYRFVLENALAVRKNRICGFNA